ncbi:helix-turn-helix domain-containing protein [Methyloversatilis discipulorum]|uniref:helix-turn-helix domain-containing protein n=1 Tax=Methyloversatilis discipulorum TaxID=1119528 RepID=UPI001A39CD41|nr:helix-turn-helix domain-containing protein [Methyloversatilis discipulorum]MBL8467350.1 helix-turn-helix domain-containing protein [Methyloversatilis discipulorum]
MSTAKENFVDHAASRLHDERKRLGLSQATAADVCEVSRIVWGKYERGQAVPGADVLMKFAAAGADVAFILTGDGEQAGLSRDEIELLALFRSAPLAVKAAAIGALQSGGKAQASTTVRVSSKGGQAAGRDINVNTDSKPAKKRS